MTDRCFFSPRPNDRWDDDEIFEIHPGLPWAPKIARLQKFVSTRTDAEQQRDWPEFKKTLEENHEY